MSVKNYNERVKAVIEHLVMLVEGVTGKKILPLESKLMEGLIRELPAILNWYLESMKAEGFEVPAFDMTRPLSEEELVWVEKNIRFTKTTFIKDNNFIATIVGRN